MILESFISTIHRIGGMRRWFWRQIYQLLARKITLPELVFMNYGWAPRGGDEAGLSLEPGDERDRSFIQLYHHVLRDADLTGKTVVEIGSGRGGGASWVARSSGAGSVVGIDFAPAAVRLCGELHQVENLEFREGDAEALPLADASVDVVYNVESSHCYGDFERFVTEVERVLKPGGVFCWADLWPVTGLTIVEDAMESTGMARVRDETITEGVLRALEREEEVKESLLRSQTPRWMRHLVRTFVGQSGTSVREGFSEGTMTYRCMRLVKNLP